MRRIVRERRRRILVENLESSLLAPQGKMFNNINKTVMYNVCGKVMRDDHIKRHTSTKHGNVESDVQHDEGHHQPQRQAAFESDAPAEDVHQDQSFASDATEACDQHDQATAAILTCAEPMKTPDNVNASLE